MLTRILLGITIQHSYLFIIIIYLISLSLTLKDYLKTNNNPSQKKHLIFLIYYLTFLTFLLVYFTFLWYYFLIKLDIKHKNDLIGFIFDLKNKKFNTNYKIPKDPYKVLIMLVIFYISKTLLPQKKFYSVLVLLVGIFENSYNILNKLVSKIEINLINLSLFFVFTDLLAWIVNLAKYFFSFKKNSSKFIENDKKLSIESIRLINKRVFILSGNTNLFTKEEIHSLILHEKYYKTFINFLLWIVKLTIYILFYLLTNKFTLEFFQNNKNLSSTLFIHLLPFIYTLNKCINNFINIRTNLLADDYVISKGYGNQLVCAIEKWEFVRSIWLLVLLLVIIFYVIIGL
ncbi:hypothetical protein TUBRATIS_30030 [Tubulinosema ratisbonensis]|uniref:Uncharacterized protein n=1 Tax=Tubulinosema ratisbonensis TaxID=291195 RepID=A0A437AHB4_9MICR|nr:hypothetical protein TUBRATIS_30030 [Tubulinosema ratisbonensis]